MTAKLGQPTPSMVPGKTGYVRRSLIASWATLPAFMWLALWSAINTGPWNLDDLFSGGLASINALRAAAPMITLVLGGFYLLSVRPSPLARPTAPEALFWLYGLAMLASSLAIDPWFRWGYWALSFLAVPMVLRAYLVGGDPLQRIVRLNYLTWATACVVLAVLVFVARDALFEAETGYGVVNRVGGVAGGAMSRSSGMARFAAIPALLAFVAFWRIRGLRSRLVATAVFAASVTLVWHLQSRGAIFSLLAALAFVMLFMGKVPRMIGVVLLVVSISGGMELVPQETRKQVVEHVTRGEGVQAFRSMSGRDRIWRKTWRAIERQPWLGYGPQSDRRIIRENVQNGFLYAWLSAGVLGVIGYAGGMLASWWCFLRIFVEKFRLEQRQRDMLMATGGLLVFFTLRSYPENTAALYSVDLLVQLPAMVYIAMLYRQLRWKRRLKRRNSALSKRQADHLVPSRPYLSSNRSISSSPR